MYKYKEWLRFTKKQLEDTIAARHQLREIQQKAYSEARAVWQEYFMRGIELPLPPVPTPEPTVSINHVDLLQSTACFRARLERIIGAMEYLPGMTPQAKKDCDLYCGAISAQTKLAPAPGEYGPFPWAEWSRYEDPTWVPPGG